MTMGRKRVSGVALTASVLLTLTACNGVDKMQTGAFKLENYAGEVISAARPFAILDMTSVMMTKKTTFDHIAQFLTGEDCSTLRADNGGHYCQPWYENKPIVPQLYCYRTLANVDCYETPSPNPGDRLIGIREGGLLPTY